MGIELQRVLPAGRFPPIRQWRVRLSLKGNRR